MKFLSNSLTKTCIHITKMHVVNDERHIATLGQSGSFLHLVGGTEQQHNAVKEYKHVGVFQVY